MTADMRPLPKLGTVEKNSKEFSRVRKQLGIFENIFSEFFCRTKNVNFLWFKGCHYFDGGGSGFHLECHLACFSFSLGDISRSPTVH